MANPQVSVDLEIVDAKSACQDEVVDNSVPATTPMWTSDQARGAKQPRTSQEGVRGLADATENRGYWLIMQGSVGSKERCPIPDCRVTFGPVLITLYGWFPGGEKRRGRKNNYSVANDLGCITHKTRPRRYFANCRPFVDSKGRSVGRPETDLHGIPFYCYEAAERHVQAVRKAYQDDPENFDATMWSNKAKAEMTVEKFVPEYLEEIRNNSITHHPDNVRAIFQHKILPRFGKTAVNGFNRLTLKQWIKDLKKEGRDGKGKAIPGLPKGKGANSVNYVKKILKTLMAFLNWLKAEEHIRFVPVMPKIKSVRKKGRPWATPELQQIFISKVAVYSKSGAMELAVACDISIRPTHVHASKVYHIKEDGIFIEYSYTNKRELGETKNGIFDTIPMSEEVLELLKKHAEGKQPNDYLFVNEKTGMPFITPELSYLVRKAAKDLKVDMTLYRLVKHSTLSQLRARLAKEAKERVKKKGVFNNDGLVKSPLFS